MIFRAIILAVICLNATAATRATADRTQAAFVTTLASATHGDTIIITNSGTQTSWTSLTAIQLTNLTIRGHWDGSAWDANSIIGKGSGDGGFLVQSNNCTIIGITFAGTRGSSSGPFVRIGSSSGCPTIETRDFLFMSNMVQNVGPIGGDVTGAHAMSFEGFAYGVLNSNTFWRCNGEVVNISGDGVRALDRTYAFGDYDSGVVYLENNLFLADTADLYENFVDGNSGQKFVARFNHFVLRNGATFASALFSTHETCALSTGLSGTCGDCGSLMSEMYGNTVDLGSDGEMRDWLAVRGGKAVCYSNEVTFTGSSVGRMDIGMWISNYRSTSTYGGGAVCHTATHARGFSQYAHEVDPGYTSEGITPDMTTLAEDLDASETTITLTSTSGMNAAGNDNGYAIKIGNEVIYYTAISGNDLTGCTRGASGSSAATHSNGANVTYLIFGRCLEQVNNVWIWGNKVNGSLDANMNDVFVCGADDACATDPGTPDYTAEDIKSFDERPAHWQYRDDGTALSYTRIDYPHPLTGLSGGGGSGVGDFNVTELRIGTIQVAP